MRLVWEWLVHLFGTRGSYTENCVWMRVHLEGGRALLYCRPGTGVDFRNNAPMSQLLPRVCLHTLALTLP